MSHSLCIPLPDATKSMIVAASPLWPAPLRSCLQAAGSGSNSSLELLPVGRIIRSRGRGAEEVKSTPGPSWSGSAPTRGDWEEELGQSQE